MRHVHVATRQKAGSASVSIRKDGWKKKLHQLVVRVIGPNGGYSFNSETTVWLKREDLVRLRDELNEYLEHSET